MHMEAEHMARAAKHAKARVQGEGRDKFGRARTGGHSYKWGGPHK